MGTLTPVTSDLRTLNGLYKDHAGGFVGWQLKATAINRKAVRMSHSGFFFLAVVITRCSRYMLRFVEHTYPPFSRALRGIVPTLLSSTLR